MRKTTNYELNIAEGSDRYNHLTIDNPNYDKIDTTMKENEDSAVQTATELKSGTVHAITRNKPNASMFRFVATSDFNSGETFTVDGQQVTALLPNGATLGTGAYHINANVLCCLVGTNMTVYTVGTAENIDATTLEGHGVDYFATAEGLEGAVQTAQSAQIVANSASNKVDKLGLNVKKVWENNNHNYNGAFSINISLTPIILLEYWINANDYTAYTIMRSNHSTVLVFNEYSGVIRRYCGVWENSIDPGKAVISGDIPNSNKYLIPKAIYNIEVKSSE